MNSRRDFFKQAAVAAVGTAVGTAVTAGTAAALSVEPQLVGWFPLVGEIADVRVYPYELSRNEINDLCEETYG